MDKSHALSEADLIPDGVVGTARDELDHDAIASVISNLACAVKTPANVALFGPWGSGKSSLYRMVGERIARNAPQVKIVKYDAWKFGGAMLQRNFLFEIASQLEIPKEQFLANLDSSTETVRLRLGRFIWRNRGSLLLAVFIALVVAGGYVAGMAAIEQIGKTSWSKEALGLIPTGATVFGLVMAGLLLSNQTLASATEKRSRSPLQDADQFSGAFNKLMKQVREKGKHSQRTTRLVVFIDELDRCKPEDVVSVLISLKTFLDHDHCVFIVAADRDVLREALEEAPQAKPVRANEPYYSTAGAFIDKIFQHQVSLPPVRAEALIDFAMTLANKQAGLWATLREQDQRSYEDVVYSLVPAHVQSPRRVKVLMNNFVTTYRAIQARELNRQPEPAEVAVLTVLQTEFPSLIQDLVHEPRLIEALLDPRGDGAKDASEQLTLMLEAYNPDQVGDDADQSPAGPLLTDGSSDAAGEKGARLKLNQQLDAYLAYIDGAGIAFPTLDLIYLQDAASVQGLEDPGLRQLLDVAHVYAPDTIAHEFTTAASSDQKAAVQFLATKANTTFGPARANLIEVACRITEMLDLTDIQAIAPTVAATVLGEARGQRWRTQATPGALLLGLLDPQQGNPLEQLGDQATSAVLAEHDVFERITPTLEYVSDERAFPVHTLLVEAYEDHPEALHRGLRVLPSQYADRLWEDTERGIRDSVQALPIEHVTPTPAPTPAPAASARAPVPEPEPETEDLPPLAQDRYGELLAALSARTTPANGGGSGALVLGLRDGRSALYDEVHRYAEDLLGRIVIDPHSRNRVALTALAVAPASDLTDWTSFIDAREAAEDRAVSEAAARCLTDLSTGALALLVDLSTVYGCIAPLLTDAAAEANAEFIAETLYQLTFGDDEDPEGQRRLTAYEFLNILATRLSQAEVQRIRREDIEHFLSAGQSLRAAIPQLLDQIDLLSTDMAEALESILAQDQKGSDEPLAIARLRVRARSVAGKRPLAPSAFTAHLSDDADSASVISDWLKTNPPIGQVESTLKKFAVGQASLGAYAAGRSIGDRSRLWITLHEAHYDHGHLAAVGRHGVNATPIEHLWAGILAADLSAQKPLMSRLLTADFSQDPGARRAASGLAIDLLNSKRVGSGKSAATLVLNAGGAGTGMTDPLRKAFDKFTTKNPRALNRGDVRRLNALNLLTKRKGNPVSKFLGWFGQDED